MPSYKKLEFARPPFLFTLDQVATIAQLNLSTFKSKYVYYSGESIGRRDPNLFLARDINPSPNEKDWRITESEVERWLKYKGFKPFGTWKYI